MSKKLLLMLAGLLAVALIGCGRGKTVEFHLKLEVPGDSSPNERKNIENNFDRYRDMTIEIIRKRLDAQGMRCDGIAPEGDRGIVVRTAIPKGKDEQMLKNLFIGGRLEFRLVDEDSDWLIEQNLAKFKQEHPNGTKAEEQKFLADNAPENCEYLTVLDTDKNKQTVLRRYYVSRDVEMDGFDIIRADAVKDQWGRNQISLGFNSKGGQEFAEVTGRNIGRQLAIVFDGRLYCAPNIMQKITGGVAQITGSFSEDESKSIADALVGGSLPLEVTVVSVKKR